MNYRKTSIICGGVFDVAAKVDKVQQLEQIAGQPDFWDDPEKAQAVMRDLTRLKDQVTVWEILSKRLNDALELAQLGDDDLYGEMEREVEVLTNQVANLEFRALFSGEYDDENAILAIHAGAGGTEAQDWAQMLQRMFIRWAESHNFTVTILDESSGDEAGIKSCLMSIEGDYVYGRLQ
ncbi:MAG: PCRF domain-containing protein, partial [Anaerolineales bacterium]|nr:PCRF domain-containing protein [Anaerolineales bacterium]